MPFSSLKYILNLLACLCEALKTGVCVCVCVRGCVCVNRSAMVQLLCNLYGLTLIIITFVFSVAAALTTIDDTADNAIYLQVISSHCSIQHTVGGRPPQCAPPLSSLCGRRSASRRRAHRACRPERSSRFPRSIRSHAHCCSCLTR